MNAPLKRINCARRDAHAVKMASKNGMLARVEVKAMTARMEKLRRAPYLMPRNLGYRDLLPARYEL